MRENLAMVISSDDVTEPERKLLQFSVLAQCNVLILTMFGLLET